MLLSIFVALMTRASCYGHIFDKGSKFYKSLVFAPFVVPKSPLTVYTHSMTVYTPRGRNESVNGEQQEVFDLIRDHISQTGMPPTRAEIAQRLGFRSQTRRKNTKALARKGC